jgi:hypothetical protein
MKKKKLAGSTPNAVMNGRASAPQLVTMMASRTDCRNSSTATPSVQQELSGRDIASMRPLKQIECKL